MMAIKSNGSLASLLVDEHGAYGVIVSWVARNLRRTRGIAAIVEPPTLSSRLPELRRRLLLGRLIDEYTSLTVQRIRAGEYALIAVSVDPLTRESFARTLFCYRDRGGCLEIDKRCPYDSEAAQEAIRCLRDTPIRANDIFRALVRRILRFGGVRVRQLGGAYFVPSYALRHVVPILDTLAGAGATVRVLRVERNSAILRTIAADAVATFRAALEDAANAFRRATTEARRAKALAKIEEIKHHIDFYAQLLSELGELAARAEVDATLDALAESDLSASPLSLFDSDSPV